MVHRLIDSARSERGALLLMAAAMWFIVAVVAAFVVDLGLARLRRVEAQTAADAAVLAALQDLTDEDVPAAIATAKTYAIANGFTSAEVSISSPPTDGVRVGDSDCIEAVISDDQPALFSSVAGITVIRVQARTVGCAGPPAPPMPAIYAESSNCSNKNLVLNGSVNQVIGGIHSNDDLDIPGSDIDFLVGAVNYTGSVSLGGSGNNFAGGVEWAPTLDPPIEYDIVDFQPGGQYALQAGALGQYYNAGSDRIDSGWLQSNAGYNSSTGRLEPGLYYTSGEIDMADSDLWIAGGGGVTLVSSNGVVKLAGSNHDLRPYVEDLLIFGNYQIASPQSSTDNCEGAAVDLSGSNTSWLGIIYAPRGQAKIAGSNNTTISGAILAWTVSFSGSTVSIDSTGLVGGERPPAKLWE